MTISSTPTKDYFTSLTNLACYLVKLLEDNALYADEEPVDVLDNHQRRRVCGWVLAANWVPMLGLQLLDRFGELRWFSLEISLGSFAELL